MYIGLFMACDRSSWRRVGLNISCDVYRETFETAELTEGVRCPDQCWCFSIGLLVGFTLNFLFSMSRVVLSRVCRPLWEFVVFGQQLMGSLSMVRSPAAARRAVRLRCWPLAEPAAALTWEAGFNVSRWLRRRHRARTDRSVRPPVSRGSPGAEIRQTPGPVSRVSGTESSRHGSCGRQPAAAALEVASRGPPSSYSLYVSLTRYTTKRNSHPTQPALAQRQLRPWMEFRSSSA